MASLKTIKEYMEQGDILLQQPGFSWKLGDEDKAAVVEALENRMPKKPIEKCEVNPVIDENGAYVDADVFVNLHCPVCDNWVGMADNGCSVFCDNCGQAIDWSEVE